MMCLKAGILVWLILFMLAADAVLIYSANDLSSALENEEADLELACDVKAYDEATK